MPSATRSARLLSPHDAGTSCSPAVPGGARGGYGSSGSAGAGATARGRLQQQLLPPAAPPPAGAVLPLMEVHRDGSKSLLGTMAIISPDGMAITARHVVVRADGFIHPRRLWVADGVVLRHVISFPQADVSLFQLTRNMDCSVSSSGGGSAAVSAEAPWPFLEIAPVHDRCERNVAWRLPGAYP